MTEVLLISVDAVKDILPISDNTASRYIRSAIVLAQDTYLEQTLGTTLTDELKRTVTGAPSQEPLTSLLQRVQKMLAHYACAYIIENVASKIANAGVVRTEDEKLYSLSNTEIQQRINAQIKRGDMYRERVQRYLCTNREAFSQYMTTDDGAIAPQLDSSATTGLWLGGVRGRKIW